MAPVDGTPVWFELNTPDPEAAGGFYTAVVGWSAAASPVPEHGGYLVATAPTGLPVAGMVTPPSAFPGLPGWMISFGCGDVDALAEKVASLGGAVHVGPMDIPGVGRFAVVSDPQEVMFSLLTGAGVQEPTAFRQQPDSHGHAVWVELATPDPAAALDFYGRLFGWTSAGSMSMGTMGDYTFFGVGDARPGAVMPSETTGSPARWSVYFMVPDIDVALTAVPPAGGRVLRGPDPIPGGNFSAKIADRDGAGVGLVGSRRAR